MVGGGGGVGRCPGDHYGKEGKKSGSNKVLLKKHEAAPSHVNVGIDCQDFKTLVPLAPVQLHE